MKYRGLMPFGTRQDVLFPTNPFESLHRELDRLVDSAGLSGFRELVPTIDVADNKDSLKITVELAGVDEKDVKVSLADDVLTIKGEKKTDRDEKGDSFHIMERVFGSFTRSLRLPYPIEEGKVEAKFDKGVLTVILPKSKEAKSTVHDIPIKGK